MGGTLDDLYLTWLENEVGVVEYNGPGGTYQRLLRQLYVTPFEWFVPNDDNRAIDGEELRDEFLSEIGESRYPANWGSLPCSMLEMLVALSRRISFETDKPSKWAFWLMIGNLQLLRCEDDRYGKHLDDPEVTLALRDINRRSYDYSGEGGLFPLKHAEEDQRQVELWYQLSAYLLENNY